MLVEVDLARAKIDLVSVGFVSAGDLANHQLLLEIADLLDLPELLVFDPFGLARVVHDRCSLPGLKRTLAHCFSFDPVNNQLLSELGIVLGCFHLLFRHVLEDGLVDLA